ncbi:unnamed protein product [Calypogeia fissa]
MGFIPRSRFLLSYRLLLLPSLVLLTLTLPCTFPTRSTFSPGTTHLSSLQTYGILPISSNFKDFIFRHHVLDVESSRADLETEPVSRRHTNAADSVDGRESTGNRVDDEVDGTQTILVPQPDLVEERPIQPEWEVVEEDETPARVEKLANSAGLDEKLTIGNDVGEAVSEEIVLLTEEKISMDTSVPSAGTEINNSIPRSNGVNSSVEISSEKEDGFEGSNKNEGAERSRPAEHNPGHKNVDSSEHVEIDSKVSSKANKDSEPSKEEEGEGSRHSEVSKVDHSDVEIVEFSSATKEDFEGRSTEEDHASEDRHDANIGDQSGPHEDHVHVPTEVNVTVTEVAAPTLPSPTMLLKLTDYGKKDWVELQRLTDDIARSGLPKENLKFPLYARDHLDLNVPLRGGLPQGVSVPKETSCEGRHAYVYNLPAKFNSDLVAQCDAIHWMPKACDYFTLNEGMGPNASTDYLNAEGEKVLVPDGSWFLTNQYALELVFYARLKHYECLTTDVNEADIFFVPFYGGQDVMRYHNRPDPSDDLRDELSLELMNWLKGQETWNRDNGSDHVFVLAKTVWNFRRGTNTHFGSRFLARPAMDIPTKLLIERDAWHQQGIGIPHPTFFHPKNDDEIRTWLAHVEQSKRRQFVSFAGMPRPERKGNMRQHLIQQCLDHSDDCFLLRCVGDVCKQPDQPMNLFLHSHFCMQPPGDSPTRRSIFDSLIGGCIPVLFDPQSAYFQYPWHLPRNASSYSVFIPEEDVKSGKADIVAILKTITPEERTAMRSRIIREIVPGLLYSQPGTKHSDFRDAFDVSMEAVFHRMAYLKAKKKPM